MSGEIVSKPPGRVPRGLRLSNPGNVRLGQHWQGMASDQPDPDFVKFVSPIWGIRALCRCLLTYQSRHGLKTVRGIISRWAPASENNTDAYVASVARAVGVLDGEPIDLTRGDTMRLLVKAIIRHENGQQPYDDATIDDAMKKAGVRVP